MPDWARARSWELLLAAILVGDDRLQRRRNRRVYLDVDNFVNLFRLSIEKVIIAVIDDLRHHQRRDRPVGGVRDGARGVRRSPPPTSRACRSGLAIVIALFGGRDRRLPAGRGDRQDRHLVAGRDARRADRLSGCGADPVGGPIGRRLPRLVRRPRPRRLPRPDAVRARALPRHVRGRRDRPPPVRVRPQGVRDRRQRRRGSLLGHRRRPGEARAVHDVGARRRHRRSAVRGPARLGAGQRRRGIRTRHHHDGPARRA